MSALGRGPFVRTRAENRARDLEIVMFALLGFRQLDIARFVGVGRARVGQIVRGRTGSDHPSDTHARLAAVFRALADTSSWRAPTPPPPRPSADELREALAEIGMEDDSLEEFVAALNRNGGQASE